jgi:hypothetical protein
VPNDPRGAESNPGSSEMRDEHTSLFLAADQQTAEPFQRHPRKDGLVPEPGDTPGTLLDGLQIVASAGMGRGRV